MEYKKLIIPVITATFALFVWNAISWMALPFHDQSLKTLPDQVVKFTELSSTKLEEGVYHYPGLPEGNTAESIQALQDKLATGPRIPLMVYEPGSSTLFNPADFLVSLLLNLMTVTALLILLGSIKVHGLRHVIAICALAGVLIATMSDLSLMNWYRLPWSFVWPGIADHVVGLVLAGWILHIIYLKKHYEKI